MPGEAKPADVAVVDLGQRAEMGGVSALSGSLIFYAITNFGVWLQGGLYEHTVSGLLRCYVNALPFLRNTMLSDMFYSASIMAIVLVYSRYRTNDRKLATN